MDLFEIIIILVVALIVIGPERLPEVMRTVAKVLRELRAASNSVMRELSDAVDEMPAPPPAATRPVREIGPKAIEPAPSSPVQSANESEKT